MTITDTHAHGLAGHDLRLIAAECRAQKDGAFREFKELPAVATAKGARRQVAQLDGRLGQLAWDRDISKDRHRVKAAWLLRTASDAALSVCCVTLKLHTGGDAQMRQWPWMIIDKHAIARSHQRLGESDWFAIQEELRPVARLSAAVLILSRALGFRQFAIPACRGLLVGDVAEDCLHAKTFITGPMNRRWSSVLDAWIAFEQQSCFEWNAAIEAAALDEVTPQLDAPLAALAEQLRALPFLMREYRRGHDTVGELWQAARRQSEAEYRTTA